MGEEAFRHGVASGDPTTDRVVIWTRVTTDLPEADVEWVVARDPELKDVVVSGTATADAGHDHTVHVDVGGLEPGVTYHYGFVAAGERSPVGGTWTLAADPERVRFVTCSCAKFNAGFFNAYARIADRGDLDFLVHLGDYIYEASNTPPKSQTPGADIGRPFDPEGECRTLADYRTRYAQYRLDPDVQALHLGLPVFATLDDHELADGAWAGGADNHHPDEHGPWDERKAAAFQARWEWLPARPPDPADTSRVFQRVSAGAVADILLLDIRSRRDQPAREPEMSDPGRSMMGAEQRAWLFAELDASDAAWRLVASPSIMSRTWTEHPEEPAATALLKLKLIDEDREGPDEDQWDGYPAERSALLERVAAKPDTLVISGDIHVSVAAELRHGGEVVAAEFTTSSLTSQNLDEKLGVESRGEEMIAAEDAVTHAVDDILWCELASHGYCVFDIDPERVRAEWWHVDGILERGGGERRAAAFEVRRGNPRPQPT